MTYVTRGGTLCISVVTYITRGGMECICGVQYGTSGVALCISDVACGTNRVTKCSSLVEQDHCRDCCRYRHCPTRWRQERFRSLTPIYLSDIWGVCMPARPHSHPTGRPGSTQGGNGAGHFRGGKRTGPHFVDEKTFTAIIIKNKSNIRPNHPPRPVAP
jgi:hypothetical protein